jgi:putative ABC transport system permease protein
MGLDVYADLHWLNQLVGESAAASEARVLALQNPGERRVFMRAIKDMPQLEAVTDLREQKQALVRQFNGAMRSSAVIMIGFAAVIFFGAILNATLISIAERRREIATFGAMGYHGGEIGRLFLRENMLTNVSGTLVGLPLGWAMLHGSMQAFQTDAYGFMAALRPVSLVYTVALAVLFVASTQWAVYRNINRMDKVEALSVKE